MISAGVKPSPAGLWRYGFEAGIGFSKHIEPEKICTHLLKPYQGTIRRDGIFMEGLEYKLALADREEWTTLARHSGAIPITMHLHPCQLEKAWIYDDQKHGLLELTLSDEARTKGKNSIYEYLDAVTRESFSRSEREHKTTKANFEFNEQNENDVKKAKALTKKAEKNFIGEKPPIKEARRLEIDAIAKDSFVSKPSSERPLKQITGEKIHSQEPAPNNPLIKKLFDSILGEEK